MKKFLLIFTLFFFASGRDNFLFGQTGECLGGGCVDGGSQYPGSTLTPTTSWQTQGSIWAGEWQLFNVTSGNIYEFSLCAADGGSCSYDGQLTLRNNAGLGLLCYSDDYCGDDPKIMWTATYTGFARTRVNLYDCNTNSTSTTLAYKYTAPAANPCASVIAIGGCGAGFAQSYTGGGAGVWSTSYCGFGTPGIEQVYSFVAPATGVYSLQVTAASGYVDYGWRAASCASTGWTCIDDISTTGPWGAMSWTAGTTYYILLDDEDATTGTHTFYINCPAADPCASVISIGGCGAGFAQSYTGGGAGVWSTSYCGFGTPGIEQVYSFVAPATGVYSLQVTAASGYVDYGWRAASCASTGWTCIDDISTTGPWGAMSWTAGTTYYILLDDENSTTGTHTFYINCPAADPCASVISIGGCGAGFAQSYTGGGAGVWSTSYCGFGTPGIEQVYSFVAPATGVYSLQITAASGYVDYGWRAASCASTGWTCIDDISTTGLWGAMSWTAGTTYYILLDDENSTAGTHTFYINCPAGDPCASVIAIGGCGAGFAQSYTGGGTGAWNTNYCGFGTPGIEQVYSFVAPTTGTYNIQITAASGYVDYGWRAASCASTGWTCIDDINTTGLWGAMSWTAGTTYYILLDDEDATTGTHTFYINCPVAGGGYLHPTAGIASEYVGSCEVAISSGNYYDDGGVAGNYSDNIPQWGTYRIFCPNATGQCLTATFSLFNTEACCDFLRVMNGSTQNSPDLFYGSGSAAIGPFTGTINGCLGFRFYSDLSVNSTGWAATFSMAPCAGGPNGTDNNDCARYTQLCSPAAVAGNSTGPGIVAEACGGGACPAGGENYSNWFAVTFNTGGTWNFTIAPTVVTDDYDYAVFGPFSGSVNCAALGNSIRCSDAAATGNTGLLAGASDFREDVYGDKFTEQMNVLVNEIYLIMVDEWTPTGAGYNLNFGGTAVMSCLPIPSPVTWLSFDAKYDAEKRAVNLEWSTASETNNDYFAVERSVDGVVFEQINIVEGAETGNSSTPRFYTSADPDPYPGEINYYRLRQVDFDGKFDYSNIVAVAINDPLSQLNIYPNPATESATISFHTAIESDYHINIYDYTAKRMLAYHFKSLKGKNIVPLDLAGFHKGVYFMTLQGNGDIFKTTFIKE